MADLLLRSMMKASRILLLGAGNMARPILHDLLARNPTQAASLSIITGMSAGKNKQSVWDTITRLPGRKMQQITLLSREEVARKPLTEVFDTVLFCAKPQQLVATLTAHRANIAPGATVISVAAGIPVSDIAAACGKPVEAVRAMPHLPLALCGLYSENPHALEQAKTLLAGLGTPVILASEDAFHAYSTHAGSGPAFAARAIEQTGALSETFVKNWLHEAQEDGIRASVVQNTIAATRVYLKETGIAPADFAAQVRSAKGMTNAGLLAMGSPPPDSERFGTPEQLAAQRAIAERHGSLPPEERYGSQRRASIFSKATTTSASPLQMTGEYTFSPYLTWVDTLPPLWAMP